MPPRSNAPGLKYGRNRQPYWMARQVVRDDMGFPEPCVPLPRGADIETLAHLCRDATSLLLAWIATERTKSGPRFARYDGSVLSLSRLYQAHPDSPFQEVKANTRKSYSDSLKIIEATIAKRTIRKTTVIDVRRWYKTWKEPKAPGGRERIDRAHDAISMFRAILRFGFALGHDECGKLDERLSILRFEKGGAREQEMTFAHARIFISAALDLGQRGVIPMDRARYMAIGVAAQFELLLRQKDIIGERPKTVDDLDKAVRRGATAISCGGSVWTGYFTWENIPGWRWRTKTSKSKYRAAADFNLTAYTLLFPLLQTVPHEERTGAIVKGEHGFPMQERSYRGWFRQIARTAGIPDTIWSMDSRAGGATEAEEAGADLEAIRDALTHSKEQEATTMRYIRRRSRGIATVAEARSRKRASEKGGSEG
jgi:hypothetical protein